MSLAVLRSGSAAKHDADLAEFQAWKAERSQVADEQTAPETKPSIDTF